MNSIESYNITLNTQYYECKMKTERTFLNVSASTIVFLLAENTGAAVLHMLF